MNMKLLSIALVLGFSQAAFSTSPNEPAGSSSTKAEELVSCKEQNYILSGRTFIDAACLGSKPNPGPTARCQDFVKGNSKLNFPQKKWAIPQGKRCSGYEESAGQLRNCRVCVYDNASAGKTNLSIQGTKDMESLGFGLTGISFYFRVSTGEGVYLKCDSPNADNLKISSVCDSLASMGISWSIPSLPVQNGELQKKPNTSPITR
jgi:hypothetical protein